MAVTAPRISVEAEAVEALHALHCLLSDLLYLVVVELQPLQLCNVVKCPGGDLLNLTTFNTTMESHTSHLSHYLRRQEPQSEGPFQKRDLLFSVAGYC